MRFEIWADDELTTTTLVPADHPQKDILVGDTPEHILTLVAQDWILALQDYRFLILNQRHLMSIPRERATDGNNPQAP